MQTYSGREIESMLGISRGVIGTLVASGFVAPSRGQRNEYRFTFQDVVLLRTAYSLREARIPARKILRSLRQLRQALPQEMPLTGLRITAVGNEIAVQEGSSRRQVDTGQLLFDFDSLRPTASVSTLASQPRADDDGAEVWFRRGVDFEAEHQTQAEAAYRRALALAPDYRDAYLNLGVMLGTSGRSAEAVGLYRAALRECPDEALLHFNLGVALEDLEAPEQALEAYERCLQLAPKLADAHYNAARLHELCGHSNLAIRHYSEYRRLQRR